ncbi:T6SS effector phospholipase Tle3 domain-containing protein [Aromatoleum sp.]|uniref:T6SS effector phospholipase Tle3 domain-containing protein n=1 Tax=Aromatoleum sp. TaxID=2307007 RepID=UPI002FCAEE67
MTFFRSIAQAEALLQPAKDCHEATAPLALPGVIILVHGVNSDGEWFDATERGLCAGLNTRLGRRDEQMHTKGVPGGQLTPATYARELTDSGFVDPDRDSRRFITDRPHHSPVIRFRWGYKAHRDDLSDFGPNVWLNEHNYWGGGPFANGCTALADLWSDGLDDRLFLWLTAQHLNPEPGRDVYGCPPRHYYAFAAWRLTELVRRIREKQADVPITLVCHSQGNMIGLAAAFYGARIGEVTDGHGKRAPAIADNYVLANAPYSLVEALGMDNWAQRKTTNAHGQSGRQTGEARRRTLANFFALIRARQGSDQPADDVERWVGNGSPRDGSPAYRFPQDEGARKGYVTLYCNPHDRVISGQTIQGIGWRGMSAAEIEATGAAGVLGQRVWAQGHEVGNSGYSYSYVKAGQSFWHPEPHAARFDLVRGLEAGESAVAKFFTTLTAPAVWAVLRVAGALGRSKINADPEANWEIPITAPALKTKHVPQAERLGRPTAFDQDRDPERDLLHAKGEATPSNSDDPYEPFRASPAADAPRSDEHTEARLRYEHRARLRMKDRRRGGDAAASDLPDEQAAPEWVAWSREQITSFLKESIDQHATDHSTIMTCAANIEKVLAWDVPVGVSRLTAEDWHELRVAADWQLWRDLEQGHPHRRFGVYFDTGRWQHGETLEPLHEHPQFKANHDPSALPPGIVDERENRPGLHPGALL